MICFSSLSRGFPPESKDLSPGNYVDGEMVIGDLPSLVQNQIPREFFLLRGNHECTSINRMYGFCDEGKRRYNIRLRKAFTLLRLQAAAIVDEKCVPLVGVDHQTFDLWSGFVHYMTNWRARARSPSGPLWAEPEDDPGAGVKDRGVAITVGADVGAEFPTSVTWIFCVALTRWLKRDLNTFQRGS